jgi:hypothetical protein
MFIMKKTDSNEVAGLDRVIEVRDMDLESIFYPGK